MLPARDEMQLDEKPDEDDRIAAEAAMWVARLQSRDATGEDRRAFEAWLAKDPAHRVSYEEFRHLWGDLKQVPIPRDRLKKLQRARRATQAGLASLVAAMLVAAGAYRMGVIDRWQSDYYTVVGEVRPITLEDGTVVALNTDSAIAIRYSAGERRVALLRGEAFFSVARNPQRPFIVDDGTLTARALGTRYSVRTAHSGAASGVQVEEGRVEVATQKGRATLDPGDTATLLRDGNLEIDRRDVDARTAWRDGKLVFSEQPLGEVLATLQRYRHGRIVVLDEAAARQKVSGVFDLGDTDRVLDALAESLPVRVTRLTDMMILVRSR
jgi:transmembrane sensor